MMKKIFGYVLCAAMAMVFFTGCGSHIKDGVSETAEETGEGSRASGSRPQNNAERDKPVTLNILTTKISSSFADYPDTPVMKELAAAIGAKINIIEADSDKYNVYMASGEGFDLILTPTTNFGQLIEGNVVVPMDQYLDEYGQDIKNNIPDLLKFSKDNWSNKTGELYFLPCQVGVDAQGISQGMGPVTRWDYYKEMGYPKTGNLDEWLNMLAEMQKKHPTTEEGLPVYGVSMFADWSVWIYKYPLACYYGYNELSGSQSGLYMPSTMEYSNLFAEDGLFWKSVEYYHKASQLGILDPDAFISKFDDFTAKGTNGQLLTGPAAWAMGDFGVNHKNEAVGYQVIPTTWSDQWGGTDYKTGWIDKCFGISSKCRNKEKAMEYINYVYSYDGCRQLYSGLEGVNYTAENGVPELTRNSIDLYLNGGEEWQKSGLGFNTNIIGLNNYTLHPKDGKTLNLFADPSVYPRLLTACQKDFSDYYKVSYPDEIFRQYRKEYQVYDQSNTDSYAIALFTPPPYEITRKEASLADAAMSAASRIILADSQEEYDSLKQQTMEEFNNIGLREVTAWYGGEWETAKKKAARYH